MALWDWMAERASMVDAAPNRAAAAQALVRQWAQRHPGGCRPDFADPARIYEYFHSGAGPEGYQRARESADTISASLAAGADGVHAVRSTLAGSWQGTAAEAALAALAPLRDRLDEIAKRARAGASMLAEQVDAFVETRRRVVPVTEQPPDCGGLGAVHNPVLMARGGSAAVNAGAYHGGARTNQDAYAEYAAETGKQTGEFPGIGGE
ncbi:PPE domain-containing protein [Sciscionella marina]|uniref:PPE domain-containing protein n=1 Tax=Sciscionella marina TaxID=508770 RepID=UPI00035D13F1|nr:PPE domain-containing protein [Sciscionella marina]